MQIIEHRDLLKPSRTIWVVDRLIEFHSDGRVYGAHTTLTQAEYDQLGQRQVPGRINSYDDIKHLFTPEELTILQLKFGMIRPQPTRVAP